MIIYKIEHIESGKVYVGKTTRPLQERITKHLSCKRGTSHISCALRKYGIKGFVVTILESAITDEELSKKEIDWIVIYNCRSPYGYNLTDGGEGTKGHIASPETRARISAANTNPSSETRAKMRVAKVGKSLSNQHLANLRAASRNRSPEILAKIAASHQYVSPESRARMSAAHTGKKHTDGTRAKMRSVHSLGLSGLRGAVWDKARGKWQAKARWGGKRVDLGRHETKEEAHKAYVNFYKMRGRE